MSEARPLDDLHHPCNIVSYTCTHRDNNYIHVHACIHTMTNPQYSYMYNVHWVLNIQCHTACTLAYMCTVLYTYRHTNTHTCAHSHSIMYIQCICMLYTRRYNTTIVWTYLRDLCWKDIEFRPRVTQNMNFTQLWNHPSIFLASPLTLPFVHANDCIPPRLPSSWNIFVPSTQEEKRAFTIFMSWKVNMHKNSEYKPCAHVIKFTEIHSYMHTS